MTTGKEIAKRIRARQLIKVQASGIRISVDDVATRFLREAIAEEIADLLDLIDPQTPEHL